MVTASALCPGNQRGRYQGGGGEDDEDLRGAADAASRHAGDSGDSDMFGGILNAISQRKGHIANNQDVDEDGSSLALSFPVLMGVSG